MTGVKGGDPDAEDISRFRGLSSDPGSSTFLKPSPSRSSQSELGLVGFHDWPEVGQMTSSTSFCSSSSRFESKKASVFELGSKAFRWILVRSRPLRSDQVVSVALMMGAAMDCRMLRPIVKYSWS